MKIGEAYRITGSIGRTSKMPGTSYGLPASACITGSKLAAVPGTICHGCYALKGNYRRGSVATAQQRRLEAIKHPRWWEAMALLLTHLHSKPIKIDLGEVGVRLQKKGGDRVTYVQPGWHRWHDSGDLQSEDHLWAICRVAEMTPQIRYWMPTQELGMVKAFLAKGGVIPRNLLIRVSEVKINDYASRSWPTTSAVFRGSPPNNEKSHICPAPTQDHKCGSCRACWSSDVLHVVYELH